MSSRFVHLHTHSEYSILDAACKIPELIDRAIACNMDALALTDHGVMTGVVKFYRQALQRGIKPILGCEIYVAPGARTVRSAQDGQRYHHLVLLAENNVGYRNLLKIVSRAHTEGFYYRPRADKDLLRQYAEGLIALSACESGEIPRLLQAGRPEAAAAVAQEFRALYGPDSFFIEIQNHGTERDARTRSKLIDLATSLNLPLVATSDIHYLTPEDKLAHEVLLNIRANRTLDDPERRVFDGEGYHFRTGDEMESAFADVPEAIENTRRIADRCQVEIPLGTVMIPPFELPEGETDSDRFLRKLSYEGAERRFDEITPEVGERLDYELSVIAKMAYSTYFLIVWDFIRFSREHSISVGPGRGSAAGSLVAYCLGITSVDPLKYNLIFERFLNPERVSMPDFDIDFCIKGRDRVIDYVREKYGGREWWKRIAQIATYDRMAARSVVRDVGRVLGFPYAETDRVAKLVPYGWKLRAAVDGVVELRTLYEQNQDIRRLIDIGLRLEGLTRNASTHAAGVVIAPDLLDNHVPLLRLGEGEFVTQFDMIDVEAVGLLKFDFLGLRNLTLIDETVGLLEKHAGIHLDPEQIPLDDEPTFAMLRDGKTAGIFQLEGSGMTNLIRRVQPDRFEDLIALLALYRPGPLESGMTDEYVERRRGRKTVSYPHPSLEAVLADTFGLPIYQDQLMLMAQRLAGFSLAQADILRKAMGKKKKDIMASLRRQFVDGCINNGITERLANETFDDMEKFSRYGFNKSHTTAYAFVSYWTAYLKAHYPNHFMASLLTSVRDNSDKVAEYIQECRVMGIAVLPPDVCESGWEFTPVDDQTIRFGLGAIKHVGQGAVQAILAARKEPFRSFFDLCRRVDGDGLDREALEALVKAGAFDRFAVSRRGLLRHLPEGLELMQVARRERLTGQQSMFGDDIQVSPDPIIREDEFAREDLLAFEKELLGLYITAHPLDHHRDLLSTFCCPLRDAKASLPDRILTIGGIVKRIRRVDTRRGGQMAFVAIHDGADEAEVTVFPRTLETAGDLLHEDALIALLVKTGTRNGETNLVAEDVFPLADLPKRRSLRLLVILDSHLVDTTTLSQVQSVLSEHPGGTPVDLQLRDSTAAVLITAGAGCTISPTPALLSSLFALPGVADATLRNGGFL